ncbi:MAG TPA: hypothetical protein VOA88_10285 [Candidatus Dormibacteraeota bacterium]|nr:hypothetical protein [Candidatus Dormibacteraeota bacterium]
MKRETALCNADRRSNAATVLPELGNVFVVGDQAILPLSEFKKISKEAWIHAIAWASKATTQVQFFLGDLINRGVQQFGRDDAIREVMKTTRLPRKTIVDYARVAAKVGAEARRPELDFSFHRVVASFERGEQEYLLNLAIERDFSVEELKFAISIRSEGPATATTNGSQRFSIRLSGDDAFILQTLAVRRGVDPVDLIQKIVADYLEEHSPHIDDVHTITAIEADEAKSPETTLDDVCVFLCCQD